MKGASAISAVRTAITVLENSELTNAGPGSNLTMNGYVECDATIVDHRGQSGAVGAARGVLRPIELASVVYTNSQKAQSLNRAPPNLIVGESGFLLAREHGVKTVSNEQMVSTAAKDQWEDNRRAVAQELGQNADEDLDEDDASVEKTEEKYDPRLSPATIQRTTMPFSSRSDAERAFGPPRNPMAFPNVSITDETFESSSPTSPSHHKSSALPSKDIISDTIGAIAIDCAGNIAAGSSSGGIALRMEGRIGPAALNGIGTHVMPAAPKDPEEKTIATVVSGTGEHLMSSLAASTASQRLYYSAQKTEDGRLEEVDDHDVLKLFVEGDFLGMLITRLLLLLPHINLPLTSKTENPAITSSHNPPAIGVLAVKKSVDGVFLHWAHNADSFVSVIPPITKSVPPPPPSVLANEVIFLVLF